MGQGNRLTLVLFAHFYKRLLSPALSSIQSNGGEGAKDYPRPPTFGYWFAIAEDMGGDDFVIFHEETHGFKIIYAKYPLRRS